MSIKNDCSENNIKSPEDFRVLIVYPNLAMMLIPSLAIGIFTKIFKNLKYKVDLFDTTHYVSEENSSSQNRVRFLQAREFSEENDLGIRIKTDIMGDFRAKVEEFKPDFMIFSVVEDAFRQCLSMIKTVEDLNIPHLVGGVFPTAAPDVCMKFPEIKMIGLGEGEAIVADVSEAIREGRPLNKIEGTWYRDSEGKINKNKKRPLIELNSSRPDFSLFEPTRFIRPIGGRIFRTFPVETYRGCPFRCTYCNSPMQTSLAKQDGQGLFLRRKSAECIREELRELKKVYDPDFIWFVDDSFLARPKKEIYDFCDVYEEFKLPFWMNTRPETCDPDILKRLKEIGAYRFSLGIEAGNEQYRSVVLKRNGTNQQIKEQFDIIANSGIAFSINLIIGFPGETRDLVMDTIRFVKEINGYDALTVSIFTPYHGTVLRDVAIKNNWLDPNYITKHTTSSSALTMPPPYLSSEDIDGLIRVTPLYCYFPEEEWPKIRRAEIADQEGDEILKYYSDIYREKFLKETQEQDKEFFSIEGGSGCRSNKKESISLPRTLDRLSESQLQQLILHKS